MLILEKVSWIYETSQKIPTARLRPLHNFFNMPFKVTFLHAHLFNFFVFGGCNKNVCIDESLVNFQIMKIENKSFR